MIDVERVFNDYVKSIGGELVSELLPRSPSFENADYLFRNQPEVIVAELKCLTKDLLKEGYQEKLNSLFDNWINRRLIPPFWGQRGFSSQNLPLPCQEELFRTLGKPIKKPVAKANEQIKQTKEFFGLKDAKGLLLLANDGNYSLEFDVLLFLVSKALGDHFSSINSIVLFTANMVARMPGTNTNSYIWMAAHRENRPRITSEFLIPFRDGWVEFHAKTIGEPVSTVTAENSQAIEKLKFVHPPEPREYYRTRNRALVTLRREIGKQFDDIRLSCRGYDAGNRQEALNIAKAVRIALHGGPNSQALIYDYFGDFEIKLRTTTMLCIPETAYFLGFLVLEKSTVEMRPVLDNTKRNDSLPLSEWWEREPVIKLLNEKNETMTRKEIVLAASNDGEVPISAAIQAKFARLEAGLGIKMLFRMAAGQELEIPFRNGHLAVLRQIGHELLRSEELMAVSM